MNCIPLEEKACTECCLSTLALNADGEYRTLEYVANEDNLFATNLEKMLLGVSHGHHTSEPLLFGEDEDAEADDGGTVDAPL